MNAGRREGLGGPAPDRPGEGPLPVLERYELKFTIPPPLVEEISAFVRPYCFLDRFSQASEDGFYQVNSLYFDSPDFLFLRRRLSRVENRFNMRVRSYGPRPVLPYFLEVKQKRGDVIRKYRARVREADLEGVLDPAREDRDYLVDPREAGAADLFRRLAHTYNAVPVVMTGYRRKAFISACDDYARVTFDAGLRYMAQGGYRPLDVEGARAPSDPETLFDEGTSVILELKCYAKYVPLWMVDLIRRFELRRRGFSKYSAGMAKVFQRYNFDDSLRASPVADFGRE